MHLDLWIPVLSLLAAPAVLYGMARATVRRAPRR